MSKTTALALVLVLSLAGCGGRKVYDRDEFKKDFMGASLGDVRRKLGAPDEVNMGEQWWLYHRRTRDPQTGKVDQKVSLGHTNDRVRDINFAP